MHLLLICNSVILLFFLQAINLSNVNLLKNPENYRAMYIYVYMYIF